MTSHKLDMTLIPMTPKPIFETEFEELTETFNLVSLEEFISHNIRTVTFIDRHKVDEKHCFVPSGIIAKTIEIGGYKIAWMAGPTGLDAGVTILTKTKSIPINEYENYIRQIFDKSDRVYISNVYQCDNDVIKLRYALSGDDYD